jgi:hypothetical protein
VLTFEDTKTVDRLKREHKNIGYGQLILSSLNPENTKLDCQKTITVKVYSGQDSETGEHRMMTKD